MEFYVVTKKFEDILRECGFKSNIFWVSKGLDYFYYGSTCYFQVDYDCKKLYYKNRIEDNYLTDFEYSFYTTDEMIENFFVTIRQKAENIVKFYKEQEVKTKLNEMKKDFEND